MTSKFVVNQLALSQVLDRFAVLSSPGVPEAREVVQLKASDGVLTVTMVDHGLEGNTIMRPFVGLSVSLPCSPGEFPILEVEVGALARLLKIGDDAGFDKTTIEIEPLDSGERPGPLSTGLHKRATRPILFGVDLVVEQKRPGGAPGFKATISYSKIVELQNEPVRAWTPVADVNGETLARRIGLVLPAMASEKGEREDLAFLSIESNQVRASDGHRLHLAGLGSTMIGPRRTIPAALARQLPALLAGSKMTEIDTSQAPTNLVRFTTLFNDLYPYEIVFGAGDGAFPDVEDVLNTERPIAVSVNGPSFAAVLKRAVDVVGDKVVLRFVDYDLEVGAGEPGISRVTTVEAVPYSLESGENRRLGFSMHIDAEYLLAALGGAQGAVKLEFVDPGTRPISVDGLGVISADLLAVVMPRRA